MEPSNIGKLSQNRLQLPGACKNLEPQSEVLERGTVHLGQEGASVVNFVIDSKEETREPRRLESILPSIAHSGDKLEGTAVASSTNVESLNQVNGGTLPRKGPTKRTLAAFIA